MSDFPNWEALPNATNHPLWNVKQVSLQLFIAIWQTCFKGLSRRALARTRNQVTILCNNEHPESLRPRFLFFVSFVFKLTCGRAIGIARRKISKSRFHAKKKENREKLEMPIIYVLCFCCSISLFPLDWHEDTPWRTGRSVYRANALLLSCED